MKCETDDYRTDLDLVSPHALAPLTLIQVNACYSIVGLPEAETALLTGSVASRKRQNIWATKRIIYCTPQVLPVLRRLFSPQNILTRFRFFFI